VTKHQNHLDTENQQGMKAYECYLIMKQKLLSIKGRTCNQTLLVHQDMTRKTTFYEKN